MARTSTSLYRAIIDGTFLTPADPVDTGDPESPIPVEGVLYPRIEAETHIDRTGREWTRRAEMTVFNLADSTEVDTDGGTILFDVAGWFGHVGWRYFEVPEGTILPDNLRISRAPAMTSNRAGTLQGRRHAVVPATRMSLQAYHGALDNLARNAVVRKIELAR